MKRIAVIGAGYIGTEIAEAAKRRGKEVLLLMQKVLHLLHIMMKSLLKGWMKILPNMELNSILGELAQEFKANEKGHVSQIVTNKSTYDVDLVIN